MKTFYGAYLAALSFVVAGCSIQPDKNSRLDSSGITVVALPDAVVLAHRLPTVAAGAREYVFIGPVEINNMGRRDYFLWLSLASTIDRDFVGVPYTGASQLVLLVDNEPMQFAVKPWRTALDTPPYVSSAPIHETLAAQATLDQIHKIANASTVEVHLVDETNSNARYHLWTGSLSAWRGFPERSPADIAEVPSFDR